MSRLLTEDILVSVIIKINNKIKINTADYRRPMRELGIDSLDLSNILLEIEEQYGVHIPDEELEDVNTIESITRYVGDHSKTSHEK